MIDISTYDLQGLQSLHISFINVKSDYEHHLDELQKQPNVSDIRISKLRQDIAYFSDMISKIEERINFLNSQKLLFSIEYIFFHYGLRARSIQIHFITTSNAYKNYGSYVTGIVLFDKSEEESLLERALTEQHNDGIIKFKPHENNLSAQIFNQIQISKLATEGFKASEISFIR
ncbi:hypothetical protein AD998_12155 [bacterium 336/3]|nr:hypothetical protein AD998_12155 [bacterium 336/3]